MTRAQMKTTDDFASITPERPDQRTGFFLQLAHQRTRRVYNQALRNLRIETRHLGVLTALASNEALNQKQFVEQLELDKSSVVLIIDDLERLGLAERRT